MIFLYQLFENRTVFIKILHSENILRASKRLPKIGTFDGVGFWKKAYGHQRGKLLRAVNVPDEQIKILVNKTYQELPAPLRYEIETTSINKEELK